MSNKSPFEKVSAQANFPQLEESVLTYWESIAAFETSNQRRADKPKFVFYDGPPFATGTPHYGHLLAGTIKDIVPRYWNMRGYPVERRFGWDCHGLPIEALAQEALGLTGTSQILERGVDVFNEQCRKMVQTYVSEWRRTVSRMGRWVDFDNDYKTMDTDFMESVWWVFKQLWDKGRVYKSHRVMPYSYKLTTPLSNFEANSNYKDVQDPAITVRFKVTSAPGLASIAELAADEPIYVLAWTTTPWTLPENLALCAGPDIDYVVVRDVDSGAAQLLAEGRLKAYYKKQGQYQVLCKMKGAELKGWTYEPLFPYYSDQANAFVILNDEFVSTADGTGIVHLAPAYGEDDFRACNQVGIELVDPLDAEARFQEPVTEYAGVFCKDADKAIIRRLKDEGKLVRQDTIVHSYPFEDRTDTPLIYRAIEAWYVKVADMREDLVTQNNTVNWVPEAVGSARFGNWLKDANDWNISRNRFWGSCIPVWVNEADPEDMICIGSIAELEALSGQRVTDLHKHIVDRVLIQKDGKTYRRTPEVLDCWFESGSMPYAQQHYPFENRNALDSIFPAQFIAEGLDQTRGWFYTLLVLGTSLFGKSPYKNVIVNGMILAEDGQKMSKRKKNYPDPKEVLDSFGADALRAYMINSPVVRGEPLRFTENGLKEIVRTVTLPFWNALSFFTTYAEVDGFDPRCWDAPAIAQRPDIDRWVLSVLQSLVKDVNQEMEAYRLYTVVPRLTAFIDDLTNWYVRSSRARFWKSEDDNDKQSAFATLYEVLVTFSKVLAPFMPFVTESAYQKLVRAVDDSALGSVHFCDYPQVQQALIDETLEQRMQVVRSASTLGRKLREEHRIKVRQPLPAITIVHREQAVRDAALASATLIKKELNVKAVRVEPDESSFTELKVKPNFKTLGKRCGPKLKAISAGLSTWGFAEVGQLESGQTLQIEGESISLQDVLLQRTAKSDAAVATDGQLTVVLDTVLDHALELEGMAREVISQLQAARKEAGLEVSDRIDVRWNSAAPMLTQALAQHADTIAKEVLAVRFEQSSSLGTEAASTGGSTIEVGSAAARYELVKAS